MSATSEFNFNAVTRSETGKQAMRRLRQTNKVPAIVYGADEKPIAITLSQKEVIKALAYEAVFSHILTLDIDGTSQKVILKAIERHETKPLIMHLDFFRIKAGEKITMNVPLHFLGDQTCPGVENGGVVSHLLNDIEVRCLPEHLPEFIEVDLSKLELDQSVHLNEVTLPTGIELTEALSEDHNPTVASVHRPKVIEEPPEEAPEEAVTAEKTETDLGTKASDTEAQAQQDEAKG